MIKHRRLKGTSLIELLIATTVVGITILGSLKLIVYCYNETFQSRLAAAAGEVARGEIERAKVWGYYNLPTGTYSSTNGGTGTWTGAFDNTQNSGVGGWVKSTPMLYDLNGNQGTASSTGLWLVVTDTITDTGGTQVLQNGSAYNLDLYATRSFVVVVTNAVTGATILTKGTTIVRGGL